MQPPVSLFFLVCVGLFFLATTASVTPISAFSAATFPRQVPGVKAWRVQGLQCAACVAHVQATLAAEFDGTDVIVELDPPVVYLSRHCWTAEDINGALASTSYSVVDIHPTDRPPAAATTRSAMAAALRAYTPLVAVFTAVLAGTGVGQALHGMDAFSAPLAMRHFMGLLYMAFAAFKLVDVQQFAAAFRRYDVLAAMWAPYARLYPFIELILGLLYLSYNTPLLASVLPTALVPLPLGLGLVTPSRLLWQLINVVAAAVAGVTAFGVGRALVLPPKGPKLVCACLGGGAAQLPMSAVALGENVLMFGMALMGLATPTPI